jgi:hypothetical protein
MLNWSPSHFTWFNHSKPFTSVDLVCLKSKCNSSSPSLITILLSGSFKTLLTRWSQHLLKIMWEIHFRCFGSNLTLPRHHRLDWSKVKSWWKSGVLTDSGRRLPHRPVIQEMSRSSI